MFFHALRWPHQHRERSVGWENDGESLWEGKLPPLVTYLQIYLSRL